LKETRLCELLEIKYPIIQAGMAWVAGAELAAAVSNAGGLGMLVATAGARLEGGWPENLREQIRKIRNLTNKPFGVNIGMEHKSHKELVQIPIEEGVKIVSTAGGSPAVHTKHLKKAGIKVIHAVASVRHARKAEAEGVDIVVATGYEGGGIISQDEIPTFVLVPQIVDVVKIPVVAAGGIADARGLVAALALGAEGVQMGTRFLATHESYAHPNLKQAILKATDTATIATGRMSIAEARVLKNEFSRQLLEKETAKMSTEELITFIGAGRIRNALVEGDMKDGSALCGAIAGMITQIVSAGEVVRGLVDGYEAIVRVLCPDIVSTLGA
jgi:enoyl-[acyl-carrier protein] reductase II